MNGILCSCGRSVGAAARRFHSGLHMTLLVEWQQQSPKRISSKENRICLKDCEEAKLDMWLFKFTPNVPIGICIYIE
jgi:hypothetical protein